MTGLAGQAAQPDDPGSGWFPFGRPAPDADLVLLCLPFAGGGAAQYRHWIGAFGPQVAVTPLQLPGRENRFGEPPYHRMDDLVTALLGAVAPLAPRRLALFGYSMGAIIAYRLALALRVTAAEPRLLMVAAHRAPGVKRRAAKLHDLPSEAFWAALERMGGTPAMVLHSPEMRQLFEPVLRADFALVETCAAPTPPQPILDLPIAAFGGRSDPIVVEPDLAAWQACTTGPFALSLLPGGHFVLAGEDLRRAVDHALRRLSADK